jgi:hypothetical protein
MPAISSKDISRFEIICSKCGGLGIAIDGPTNAPSDTAISCRHCGSPRGSLAALRQLSLYGKHDQLEF